MKLQYKAFLVLLFLIISSVGAQQQYSGSFQLTDSISGFAVFDYRGDENAPTFVGDFSFEYAKKTDTLVESLVYKGKFKENKKDGAWLFSKKNLITGDTIKVDNYQISYPASGIEHKVDSEFKDGKANGKWFVIEQNFRNAKPTDTIFSSEVSFEDSFMKNQLVAKSKNLYLEANFDKKGHADGRWLIQHLIDGRQVDEIRIYDNGVFTAHFFKLGDEEYEINHIGLDTTVDDDEDEWESIDIKDAYFDIFELSNFGFESNVDISELKGIQDITKKTNEFLKKSINSFAYHNNNQIWTNITDEQAIGFGTFKVRKFDYTNEEKEMLTAISSNQHDISKLINAFFDNPQVEIGRVNLQSLNKYHRIFKIYKDRKKELQNVANKITNPSLVYLEREKFIKNFAPNFNFPNEITYEFSDEQYSESHDFPKIPVADEFNIKTADSFFNKIKDDLSKLSDEVESLLNDLEKQEELNELEQELLNKRNKIQFLFSSDNDNEDYNKLHEMYTSQAQNLAANEFKKYVSIPLDEKKIQIDEYINCFDEVLKLYDFLADFTRKLERIDDEYTRVTFNAFVMVEMEERVKERVYQAFENIALPYFLESLQENFECDQIEAKGKNLEILYGKMIELRDQDTQGIERRLRRVKDAEEILSILEIEIK